MSEASEGVAGARARLEALLSQARQALAAGDIDQANVLLERALSLAPTDRDALRLAAECAMHRGDLASTLARLGTVRDLSPDDAETRHDLGMVLARAGRLEAACDELRACLRIDPQRLLARLHLGSVLMQRGQRHAGCGEFLRALQHAQTLTVSATPGAALLRDMLAGANVAVQAEREAVFATALAPSRARHGDIALARIQRCIEIFLGRREPAYADPRQRPAMMYIPGLHPRRFFERDEFPWMAALESAAPLIRAELEILLRDGLPGFEPYVRLPPDTPDAEDWRAVNHSLSWSALHLYRHGQPVEANLAKLPQTRRILDTLPLMTIRDHAPEVLFSVLQPKARIPPHFGSVNGRLIVHLPLVVPANCGALQVAGEARAWEEGRCLVFDDSFEHQAWNDSDEVRVVMLIDIWNPQLSAAEREGLAAALAAIDDFHAEAYAEAMPLPGVAD